jgi:aromatic ring hydroxylase
MSTHAHTIESHPLSARFDETDVMVIFDDVLVPWERVFIHRDAELRNGFYNRTGIMPQIMHQFSTKNLAKSELMMGLAFAIAKSIRIDQHLHVQGMRAEPVQFTECCRACLRASEADAAPSPSGVMTPTAMPLWTVRMTDRHRRRLDWLKHWHRGASTGRGSGW